VSAAAIYYIAGEYRHAIEESQLALEFEPRLPTAFYYMGVSHFCLGEVDDAVAALSTAARESERHPASIAAMAYVLAETGRAPEALQIVEEMKERATRAEVAPYYFAEMYLSLKDERRALDYLQRSHQLRIPDLIGIAADPLFRRLHGHPEFEQLIDALDLRP
jgi:tetratricopeptide (TPR) repeat protein